MKKALSLILVFALCFGLCACGGTTNQKYVGTYTNTSAYLSASISEPFRGSVLYKDDAVSCDKTITLNADGTGTVTFTPTEEVEFTNKAVFDEMCNGTLTWSVDGEYLSVTYHLITYVDSNDSFKMTDTRREITQSDTYELKGTQLISVSGSMNYTKN